MAKRRIGQEAFRFASKAEGQTSLDALSCLIDWAPADRALAGLYPSAKGEKLLAAFGALRLLSGRILEVKRARPVEKPHNSARGFLADGNQAIVPAAGPVLLAAAREGAKIEAVYLMLVLIHVFLDNARYYHAKLVREWLARPGCRIPIVDSIAETATLAAQDVSS